MSHTQRRQIRKALLGGALLVVILVTLIIKSTEANAQSYKPASQRLAEITLDAKLICRKAFQESGDNVRRRMEYESDKRRYTNQEKYVLGLLCLTYRQGIYDATGR